MKKIVCEMCECTQFVKEGDLFVCQGCGCKYSPEEAKKMMIEVEGEEPITAPMENTDELKRLYQAARNARETSDDASALKHYETISAQDPNSWEAMFYLVILKTNSIKNSEIGSAAVRVCNCLPKVFELINTTISNEEEKKKAVKEVVLQCGTTAVWLVTASQNFYKTVTKGNGMMALTGISGIAMSLNSTGNAIVEDKDRRFNIASMLLTCGNKIEELFGLEDKDYLDEALFAWKSALGINDTFKSEHGSYIFNNDFAIELSTKVHRYDSSFPIFTGKKTNASQTTQTTSNGTEQKESKAAIILGILGIIFAWLFAGIGHILSVIGIVLGAKEYKATGKTGGLVLSIIGEVCAVLSSLIGIASMM